MREFETGATRDSDEGKLDYEGFLHPLAVEAFATYMHKHRKQADGRLRDSDNWQKGMPSEVYMKSLWRHFMDTWKRHRGHTTPESQIENLCAMWFNVQGLLVNQLMLQQASFLAQNDPSSSFAYHDGLRQVGLYAPFESSPLERK